MRKTAIVLADGRDLVYYDADDAPERVRADQRELEPSTKASEIRYDPILGQWVMVAAHRQERTHMPLAGECPLCPSRPGQHTEIPEFAYQVAVFENRFPALVTVGSRRPEPKPGALPGSRTGQGRCEVVCFTADHDASFSSLPESHVHLVIDALIHRTHELSGLAGVEQVFCFENRGREIGVTLDHSHGQIYAYPFVTPRTRQMVDSATAYHRRTGENLFDDRLSAEVLDGSRVIFRTEHWTAFVPYAARWPYEVHLYPNRRVPDLAGLTSVEKVDLVRRYLDLLQRFDRLFDRPAPYVAAWHQAPVREGREQFAFHLELFTVRRTNDKLKFQAGSESGMDAFANDVLPETAAERLRQLGDRP